MLGDNPRPAPSPPPPRSADGTAASRAAAWASPPTAPSARTSRRSSRSSSRATDQGPARSAQSIAAGSSTRRSSGSRSRAASSTASRRRPAPRSTSSTAPPARSIGAYRLPILRDAPEVTVELIESEEAPGGVTELAVPTAAPAVANALSRSPARGFAPCRWSSERRVTRPPTIRRSRRPASACCSSISAPPKRRSRARSGSTSRNSSPIRASSRFRSWSGSRSCAASSSPRGAPLGPRLSPGLDRRGLAARGDHRAPGKALAGAFGPDVIVDHAMRYGRPAIADRIDALKAAVRADPDRAALSAILRGDDGDGGRRSLRPPAPDALAAGDPDAAALS